jgi:predicted ABC-type transport system involved in lysophospholipase L1 biosynthesis ATPase subunit
MTTAALCVTEAWHGYQQGGRPVDILRGVDLAVEPGECVAVVGRSGSGKSTLLHLAAGLAVPAKGRVTVNGQVLGDLSAPARAALRRRGERYVFQFLPLLAHLSYRDNVALPLVLDGRSRAGAHRRADALLEEVGLVDRAAEHPAELSGGEMQRVAIARALAAEPQLVLADEPTGNLDEQTAAPVLDLLLAQVRERAAALVLVTHDTVVAGRADRVQVLVDGRLSG